MKSHARLLVAILLALVVGVASTACGGGSSHSAMGHDSSDMSSTGMMGSESDGTTHSAAQMGTGHKADVLFTQRMIPHHQQAVEMANLALDPAHEASAAVKDLATRIKTAQTTEITDMTAWLKEWGAAAPSTDMEHMGDNGMGMMATVDMTALANAKGAAFDRLWLEGMIGHHEGAVTMASHIATRGMDPRVLKLSNAIEQSQTAEIAKMRALLNQ